MATMLFTEISIRALKGSDQYVTYFDTKTPGFGVRVGKRSKTFLVVRGRDRERVSIGRFPDVSLSDARTEAKKLLSTTPEEKAVDKTWKDARDEFLEDNYKDSTSRHPHIVKLLFKKHFKKLDLNQLSDITDDDIRTVLDKLKATPSAQLHAYRAARAFLKWCTRPPRRYIKISPMEGYAPPGRDKKGTRTLTDDELKAVWNATGKGSRSIFRLLILWGTRNEETCVLERKWKVEDVLTIPGSATKNGRDHSIPVLPLAKTVLDNLPETGPYFFRGRHYDNKSLTPSALNRMRAEIMEETGTTGWQIRDIRRTFRSNMARLKVPRDLCELLINHAPPVLDEIYDRYDRLEEKREALDRYEAFMLKLLRAKQ